MKFEIINPSDKCFMIAEDLMVAAIAVSLLSEGKYALEGVDNDKEVPLFLFGGHDEWFKNQFDLSFEEAMLVVVSEKKPQLISALESIEYESERGSLNNIQQRGIDFAVMVKSR